MTHPRIFTEGHDAGQKWIAESATLKQRHGLMQLQRLFPRAVNTLLRLDNLFDGNDPDLIAGELARDDLPRLGEAIGRIMLDAEGIKEQPDSFWQLAVGDHLRCHDNQFVYGFTSGALKAMKPD